VNSEDSQWVWDHKSAYPRIRYRLLDPDLGNTPNVSMTGIVSPKHQISKVECRWGDEEYANAGYAARSVSFVSENVADDRSVLQSSTTIILLPIMITQNPTKGRGRANLYHQEIFRPMFS
jgi:hypothetical protein